MKKIKIKNKFKGLKLKYVIFFGICLISIIALNISISYYHYIINSEENAIVIIRNVLRMGNKARTQIDKIWNLSYETSAAQYKEKYRTDVMELIPLLISIDMIETGINNLNFDISNESTSKNKIIFKALMKDSIHEEFLEPSPEEYNILRHILATGYGDYRTKKADRLDFYRPIIINHNRLEKRFGQLKGQVIGLYKISIPNEIIFNLFFPQAFILLVSNLAIFVILLVIIAIVLNRKIRKVNNITLYLENISNEEPNEIELDYKGEFGEISKYIHEIAHQIKIMKTKLKSVADYVEHSVDNFKNHSHELNTSSKEQFIQIQEVQDIVSNLGIENKHSSKIAKEVNLISQESLKTTELSSKYVNEIINGMVDLTSGSREIENILKVIKEIAFQTNLLAHNASIEAARAGEHGKGFSVVAQSVSELAKKSSESTKEIEELMKNTINDLERGTQKVTNLGSTFKNISQQLGTIADYVLQLNDILNLQSDESYNVNDIINKINKMNSLSNEKHSLLDGDIEELRIKTNDLKVFIMEKNEPTKLTLPT